MTARQPGITAVALFISGCAVAAPETDIIATNISARAFIATPKPA
jgi:hypothetical protein